MTLISTKGDCDAENDAKDIYCDDIVISAEIDYINQKRYEKYGESETSSDSHKYRWSREGSLETKVIWIMIQQIINNGGFYLNNKNRSSQLLTGPDFEAIHGAGHEN